MTRAGRAMSVMKNSGQGPGCAAIGLERPGISALLVGPSVDVIDALGPTAGVPAPGVDAKATHEMPLPRRVLEPELLDGGGARGAAGRDRHRGSDALRARG